MKVGGKNDEVMLRMILCHGAQGQLEVNFHRPATVNLVDH